MGPIKVRKPQAIFFDLSGTATKSYFMDSILFPYIKLNCTTYLHNNWDNPVLQRDIELLRKQSREDGGPIVADADSDKREIQKTILQYVTKCLDELRDNSAINIFRLHMWFDGYHRDKIETPVYSDVAIQIKHWRITQNIKLFVLSNGWIEATKRFMAKTNHGDLNLLIDGHFDNTIGPLDDPETFKIVCRKINIASEHVLFLTKSVSECNAAKEAGLNAILVMTHRRDLARLNTLTDEQRQQLIYIRSFNEITFIGDNDNTMPKSKAVSSAGSSHGSSCNTTSSTSPTMSNAFAPGSQKHSTSSQSNQHSTSVETVSSKHSTSSQCSSSSSSASNNKSLAKSSYHSSEQSASTEYRLGNSKTSNISSQGSQQISSSSSGLSNNSSAFSASSSASASSTQKSKQSSTQGSRKH